MGNIEFFLNKKNDPIDPKLNPDAIAGDLPS